MQCFHLLVLVEYDVVVGGDVVVDLRIHDFVISGFAIRCGSQTRCYSPVDPEIHRDKTAKVCPIMAMNDPVRK